MIYVCNLHEMPTHVGTVLPSYTSPGATVAHKPNAGGGGGGSATSAP